MTAIEAIAKQCEPQMKVLRDEPLSRHTTFGIGGAAALLVQPETLAQAALVPSLCHRVGVPYLVLGNGSNLLVADEGWQGVVIKAKCGLQGISLDGETVTADSGLMLAPVAAFAADAGLDGMAWAHGIPGTVGGAARMNGGAYDGCMSDIIESVQAVDVEGKVFTLTAAECDFGYRHSIFTERNWLILRVTYRLRTGDKNAIWQRMEELMAKRKKSQPLEYHSAGSYFKRPAGHYAAALIDGCGLKGYRNGDAQVSEKHAGFVINRGTATAQDILALERHVKATVLAQTGVTLECEVEKLGLE